eukprot:ANDGO_02100.mRNA.1 hypothetical protein
MLISSISEFLHILHVVSFEHEDLGLTRRSADAALASQRANVHRERHICDHLSKVYELRAWFCTKHALYIDLLLLHVKHLLDTLFVQQCVPVQEYLKRVVAHLPIKPFLHIVEAQTVRLRESFADIHDPQSALYRRSNSSRNAGDAFSLFMDLALLSLCAEELLWSMNATRSAAASLPQTVSPRVYLPLSCLSFRTFNIRDRHDEQDTAQLRFQIHQHWFGLFFQSTMVPFVSRRLHSLVAERRLSQVRRFIIDPNPSQLDRIGNLCKQRILLHRLRSAHCGLCAKRLCSLFEAQRRFFDISMLRMTLAALVAPSTVYSED